MITERDQIRQHMRTDHTLPSIDLLTRQPPPLAVFPWDLDQPADEPPTAAELSDEYHRILLKQAV